MPTATASERARSRCTFARASGPVTHFDAPRARRDASVERERELERDVRQARRDVLRPRRDSRLRTAPRARRAMTSTPAARSARCPPPSTCGFGSRQPMTTRATLARDDRVGARRRAAVVVARLERHVERRARGAVAGGAERGDLGVLGARALVVAGGDELVALARRPRRRAGSAKAARSSRGRARGPSSARRRRGADRWAVASGGLIGGRRRSSRRRRRAVDFVWAPLAAWLRDGLRRLRELIDLADRSSSMSLN